MSSRVPMKEKVSFGIGALGKSMSFWMMNAYVMIFFTDVVNLNPAYVAFLFLFARLWDAFNDPFMGFVVDNTKTRWGKFRPWIFIGAVANAIIIPFLYFDPSQILSPIGVMIWCGVFYIIWGMTFTIIDIPFWSLIPAVTSDARERDVIAVIPRTCSMIGGQFVVIFGLPIITYLGTGLGATEADGYLRFAFIVVACFLTGSTICAINVREHVTPPVQPKITIRDLLSLLFKNDQLVVIIILTVINNMAQNLVNGTIIYYFKYILINQDVYPYFMGCGAVAQFLAFMSFPVLVQHTSRRFVFIGSASIVILGYLGLFLVGSSTGSNIFVAGALYSIASAGCAYTLVCTTVMLADTVDYGEFKFGTRSESIVFSMQTMTAKLAGALAGFTSSLTLSFVGYVPNVAQSEHTIFSLRVVMFVVSSILILATIIIYVRFYKLNGSFYKNMLSALEVSRSKKAQKNPGHIQVSDTVAEVRTLVHVNAHDKEEVINLMLNTLDNNEHIKNYNAVVKAIWDREFLQATGMGEGIALPHCKCEGVDKPQIVIATLVTPVDFGAPDGRLCDLVAMIVSPDDGNAHLATIGRMSIVLNDMSCRNAIRNASSADEIVHIIASTESKVAAVTPSSADLAM